MEKMGTAIWWVRRDLRLDDNQALQTAVETADKVVPVFILDPGLLASSYSSENRNAFLFDGLRRLDEDLRHLGSYLIIRRGEPVSELCRLAAEVSAEAVFAEPDYSPYARRRDERAGSELMMIWCGSPAAYPPEILRKGDGTPYTIFTPFSRAWMAVPNSSRTAVAARPDAIQTPANINGMLLAEKPERDALFSAGEDHALRRLDQFINEEIDSYHLQRDRMDLNGTSALSPYLRFGMLSARRAVDAAKRAADQGRGFDSKKGPETWLRELIWRDFYISILHHFPQVRSGNFRPRRVRWGNDPTEFLAWKAGQTGYPIVDAAMRQLAADGWIHNRARMIVASFLTKDLLIDWRWGERWFMQNLIDGDPASNNGGWQWVAGTGTDAAPYFRIFNPVLQSQKADPYGRYIRRWIPELNELPDSVIHTPWKASKDEQRKGGCQIGRDYPYPIVDHAQAKMRVMEAYR